MMTRPDNEQHSDITAKLQVLKDSLPRRSRVLHPFRYRALIESTRLEYELTAHLDVVCPAVLRCVQSGMYHSMIGGLASYQESVDSMRATKARLAEAQQTCTMLEAYFGLPVKRRDVYANPAMDTLLTKSAHELRSKESAERAFAMMVAMESPGGAQWLG